MAGTDRTAAVDRQAVLVVDSRLSYASGFDADGSTYTEAGPYPGVPEPLSESELVLDASGQMLLDADDEAEDFTIQINRPGFAEPAGAAYVYSIVGDTSSPRWVCWDGPQVMTDFRFVDRTTTVGAYKHPHAVTLSTGEIVAVVCTDDQVVGSVIRDADGDWGYGGDLYDQGDTYASSVTDGGHQTVIATPQGRLIAYYLVELSSSSYQVGMGYSDDKGQTWTEGSRGVLPSNIDTSTYDIKRLRAVLHNGRIGLFLGLVSGTDYEIRQYASIDTVAFSLVDTIASGGGESDSAAEVIAIPHGPVVVAWLHDFGSGSPQVKMHVRILANVYEPVEDDDPISIIAFGSGTTLQAHDLALWRDDDGNLYAMVRDAGGNHELYAVRSIDGGETWGRMGTSSASGAGATVFRMNESGSYIGDYCVVSAWGQGIGLSRMAAATASHDDSLVTWTLGGPTTVPMPYASASQEAQPNQIGWEFTYIPIEEPGDVTAITVNTTGTPTTNMHDNGARIQHTSVTDSERYSIDLTDGLSGGAITDVRLDSVVGTWVSDIEISDGSGVSYKARVRVRDTDIALQDIEAGTTIATVSTTAAATGVWIRLAVGNPASSPGNDGRVRAWYAPVDTTTSRRRYYSIGSSNTLQAGTSTSSEATVGTLAGDATADGFIAIWCLTSGAYTGKGLHNGQNSPERVQGRTLSAMPGWMDRGVRLQGKDGPALTGEQWSLVHRSHYPVSALFYDQDAGRSRGWRSVSNTAASLVLRYHDTGTSRPPGAVLALYLGGWNVADLELWAEDNAGTWSKLGDIDMRIASGLGYTRSRELVRPNQSATGNVALYLHEHALAGCHWISGGGSYSTKIQTNHGGVWAQDTGTPPVGIVLEDLGGSEPNSGADGEIVTDNALVYLPAAYTTMYRAFRVDIPSQATPTGDFRGMNLALGHLRYFSSPPDWGTSIGTRPNSSVYQSRSGGKRVHRDGAPIRYAELAWTAGVYDGGTRASSGSYPQPPVFRAHTAGGGPIVAGYGDMGETMLGLMERLGGQEIPLCYAAAVPTPNSADLQVITDSHSLLWGRIVSDIAQYEIAGGADATGVLTRVNAVRVESEP